MLNKEAIAVYNPDNHWEQCIQEAAFKYTACWLSSYHCQLLARATRALKWYSDWTENDLLGETRASFFFRRNLAIYKDRVVFVTYPLFLRDINESEQINDYVHGPICLMSRTLARWIFSEYPVHIELDWTMVEAQNEKFMTIGNVLIADGFDVNIKNAIQNQINLGQNSKNIVDSIMNKAAMSEIEPGVFAIDRQDRFLKVNMSVQDKFDKEVGVITEVEPGDTGLVFVSKGDNHIVSVSKSKFDHYFVVK